MRPADEVLADAVDAHGGAAFWNDLTGIHVGLTIGGAAIALKGRSPRARRVQIEVETRAVAATITLEEGDTYRLEGHRIERLSSDGWPTGEARVVGQREDGRTRARLLWDRLDVAFFLGCALWNYAQTPWLLTREGMRAETLEVRDLRGRRCERVRVRFPDDVPTHSPTQDFWFTEDGRLARLDYTAYALAPWARGAHEVDEYRSFDGVPFPARRRVWLRPLGGTAALRLVPAMAGKVEEVRWVRG